MKTVIALWFLSFAANGQQVMNNAKLTSCTPSVCSRLVSEEIHRSNLSPNIMAFGEAAFEIYKSSDGKNKLQSFKAGDGYIDLEEQILVLRDLKNSKHRELIYNLSTNSIDYY